jgi:ATP-dependent DNA helicase RecG
LRENIGDVVVQRLTRPAFARTYPDEGDTIEFKAGAGVDPLRSTMVAFSNARGGTILIGVDDSGRVAGCTDPRGVVAKVHAAARDVRDLGRYTVEVLLVDGRAVVRVVVERRVNGFAQLPSGLVLSRRGEHDLPLFGAELATFLMGRQLQRFESQTIDAPWPEADPRLVAELVEVHGWQADPDNVEARLRERGLLDPGGSNELTVAGALFLAPAVAALGKSFVELRRYPDEGDAYDKRLTVTGAPQEQVQVATQRVLDELGNEFVVSGTRRYELPKLPPEVVREAVANAVAHRSYEANGTATVIEIRPGRVVVRSPGGLPEGVTVANLRDAQSSRNMVVIDVLRRFRVAEDAGRGIDVMQDRMADALLDPPRFADLGHAFEVVLPVHSPITPDERAWVIAVEDDGRIQRADRLLLVHAARGERLTNATARAALGVDSAAARAALQRLCEAGLLVRRGTRGGAHYVLSPTLGSRVLADEEMEELVLRHAGRLGYVNNHVIRLVLGIDRARALALLERLVERGRLVRIGEKRGTRYVPSERHQG